MREFHSFCGIMKKQLFIKYASSATRLLEFAIRYKKIVKFYIVHIELMNQYSGTNDNNNIGKIKAIAAIPMAGIIVTAALVSGLVSFMGNSYQRAIAQTGNATTTTTTTTGGGQFPCAPVQTAGGGGGGQNTSTSATTTTTRTTMDGPATAYMNTTSSPIAEGNQSIGEVAIHIQEACLAAHNNDISGVLLHLNLALDALNALRGGGAANATASLEERGLMLDPGGPQLTEGGLGEER
jgi:hypothetical protein